MPLVTTDLALGGVFLDEGVGVHESSVVVGQPPQWSDGLSSTYATTHHTRSILTLAAAPFDSLVSSVTQVRSIQVTATIAGGGQAGVAVAGLGHYPRDGYEEIAGFNIPGDTTARVYTAALGLEYGAPPLVTGGVAWFWFQVPGHTTDVAYAATCFELTLTVTYWTGQPPRRIFPRDDGLTGGAPRTYPPSKGLQSGNRTSGGYL